MITYDRSAYGINLLCRIHGSAVYRAMAPGLIAVAFFLWIRCSHRKHEPGDSLGHPYAFGVLISTTMFQIVFRANQAYARYWEAAGAVHHMLSKWMDATCHASVFHMQAPQYDKMKPPSFFKHVNLDGKYLTRDRERMCDISKTSGGKVNDETQETKCMMTEKTGAGAAVAAAPGDGSDHSGSGNSNSISERNKSRAVCKSINYITCPKKRAILDLSTHEEDDDDDDDSEDHCGEIPRRLTGRSRLDGNWGAFFQNKGSTYCLNGKPDPMGFAGHNGGQTPPLFLQELAHLASLLTAVALSTLRNDIEGAESPLGVYIPASAWPEVDPDKDRDFSFDGSFDGFRWTLLRRVKNFLGVPQSAQERTRYNASRPIPVLGGVSDAEITFLQMARGPHAKCQLAWAWLSEFITREHLEGNMGKVGSPMIARIMQFLGDGMIYYNHARKIMFIPFPFAHAQLSACFVLSMIPAIPYMMDQYAEEIWLGCVLSFFAVVALVGIHEVARELENPFRNVPNELPLVTLQAQFNEALLTIFAGYHPDLYFDTNTSRRRVKKQHQVPRSNEEQSKEKQKEATTTEQPSSVTLSPTIQNQDKEITESISSAQMAELLTQLQIQVTQQEKELQMFRQMAAKQQNGGISNPSTTN